MLYLLSEAESSLSHSLGAALTRSVCVFRIVGRVPNASDIVWTCTLRVELLEFVGKSFFR